MSVKPSEKSMEIERGIHSQMIEKAIRDVSPEILETKPVKSAGKQRRSPKIVDHLETKVNESLAKHRRVTLSSSGFGSKATDDATVSSPQYFDVKQPTASFCPYYQFVDSSKEDVESGMFDGVGLRHSESPLNLRELGAGYLNDSFVQDDGMEMDSLIPNGWTTRLGGFYIGTGKLYIRPLKSEELEANEYQRPPLTGKECVKLYNEHFGKSRRRRTKLQQKSLERVPSPEV